MGTFIQKTNHKFYDTILHDLRYKTFTKVVLCSMIFLLLLSTVSIRPAKAIELVPPSPPDVPPLITVTYSNDSNSNHIEDTLEFQFSTVSSSLDSKKLAINLEMVDVQLTFSEQITQQQIDDFLGIGGEITYIYKCPDPQELYQY